MRAHVISANLGALAATTLSEPPPKRRMQERISVGLIVAADRRRAAQGTGVASNIGSTSETT
jgi:hypothetical protein